MNPAYKSWLVSQGYPERTISSRIANARRVEVHYGDLDVHFEEDQFVGLLAILRYSTEDERRHRPNPTAIPIVGNIRNNLASYASSILLYGRFAASGWDDSRIAKPRSLRPKRVHSNLNEQYRSEDLGIIPLT